MITKINLKKYKIFKKFGILPGITKTLKKKIINKVSKKINKNDYIVKLQEKQNLKINYGISEKKLSKYFTTFKKSNNINKLRPLQLIESRLDCILYRANFTLNIRQAKQIINHKQILINNKNINISSYICKSGDLITINAPKLIKKLIKKLYLKAKNILNFRKIKYNIRTSIMLYKIPSHIFHKKYQEGIYFIFLKNLIKINTFLLPVDETKILEHYN